LENHPNEREYKINEQLYELKEKREQGAQKLGEEFHGSILSHTLLMPSIRR
jgi:hypothetical protein